MTKSCAVDVMVVPILHSNVVSRIRCATTVINKYVKARAVPFSLRAKVEEELDRLEAEGTKVQHSDWATPIVPVFKKNGSVRICGVFTLNPLLLVDQYPPPKMMIFSQT